MNNNEINYENVLIKEENCDKFFPYYYYQIIRL